MKYIDADKLIANLERQNTDKKVIELVIRIINSLKQEQLEDTEKQKPVVQWPNLSNCKHDCKTCFAKCFYRKEQNKEQQPEVDLNLEREIQLWLTQLHNRPTSDELRTFATHFYELGLNTRKKE